MLLPDAETSAVWMPYCFRTSIMRSTAYPFPMPPGSSSTPGCANRTVRLAASKTMLRYPTRSSAAANLRAMRQPAGALVKPPDLHQRPDRDIEGAFALPAVFCAGGKQTKHFRRHLRPAALPPADSSRSVRSPACNWRASGRAGGPPQTPHPPPLPCASGHRHKPRPSRPTPWPPRSIPAAGLSVFSAGLAGARAAAPRSGNRNKTSTICFNLGLIFGWNGVFFLPVSAAAPRVRRRPARDPVRSVTPGLSAG